MRVVWFQLVHELERHGLTIRSIAHEAGCSPTAIYKYKEGSEPGHSLGEVLIEMYRSRFHKDPPMVDSSSAYLANYGMMPGGKQLRSTFGST